MMTLEERIHARMIQFPHVRRRLEGIPPAVVEEVLRLGIQTLSDMVPMETLASELTSIEFDACEGCGHLIDPGKPEGAVYGGEDGIWLCDACQVEDGGAAPESAADADTAGKDDGR